MATQSTYLPEPLTLQHLLW